MSTKIKKAPEKITVPNLRRMYQSGDKIAMVTAYDATMARIADDAGAEMVLVGDSLGMVVQGKPNTLDVSMDDMIYHTRCVASGLSKAHLVSDMPFLSYQISHEEAVRNAGELVKAGAESVKLEGGEEIADLIWYLYKVGIPVIAHIGLKPQSIHTMGGYKTQGKTKKDAESILNEAKILEEAGAYCILMEGVPLEVAQKVTEAVDVPTIGIGSGPHCSGQVLVCYDLLGALKDFKPRFVKQYMNLYDQALDAFKEYVSEVKEGDFPSTEHSVHRGLVEVKNLKKK